MDLKVIEKRKNELANAGEELKKKFVGLDEVIDRIISEMEAWYCVPEIVNHPTIICLWGMTGVGKTDLVRTLRDLLHMKEDYCEVTFDESSLASKMLIDKLEGVIDEGKPGILLLDEMQRFRCKDESGRKMRNLPYMDTWELLSDGKIRSTVSIDMLYEMTLDYEDYLKRLKEYNERQKEGKIPKKSSSKKFVDTILDKREVPLTDDEDDDDEEEESKPPTLSSYAFRSGCLYNARRIKRVLKLTESAYEIANWPKEKLIDLVKEFKDDKEKFTHTEHDYSKLLVFVSGNLDNAYNVSTQFGNDIPADYYHELCKHINIHTIKRSLGDVFLPEQIARLGNNHVIYPALSEANFRTIIKMKCDEYVQNIKKDFKITLTIEDSIYDLIYRNGVYPTQGTRPVFSEIKSILESGVTELILKALIAGEKFRKAKVSYEDKQIVLTGRKFSYEKNHVGEIDFIKWEKLQKYDFITHVSVHEAGHAVVYGLLFGHAPLYTVSLLSGKMGGYVMPHQIIDSEDNIKKQCAVWLAGLCAEEMVFGKSSRSSGCYLDVDNATVALARYIRRNAMGSTLSKVVSETTNGSCSYNTALGETNEELESLIEESKKTAMRLLKENTDLYKVVAKELNETKEISQDRMVEIFRECGYQITKKSMGSSIIEGYEHKFNEWLEEQELANAFRV